MRLTTIGTGTVAPSPTRVCAGHLVEAGDVRLLMDCGGGVVHRMAQLGLAWGEITHVALTHYHPDHVSDLVPLVMAFRYGQLPARRAPLVIVGPPGVGDFLASLTTALWPTMLDAGFPVEVREAAHGEKVDLGGGTTLESHKVPHTNESVAYSVEHGGRRFVYTGDTGPDAALGAWASGCDVLLAECSLPSDMAVEGHLTPETAADLAAAARPGLLALTHFYPPVERVDVAALVAQRFDGPVALAVDGWRTELGAATAAEAPDSEDD
jgi:ribonuclease BN (tRNA processing enzyme)